MSDTIRSLIEGNKQFKKKFFIGESTPFNELVLHGQKPKACIVACSDSRVDPDLIFNCNPGDLFTLRNVAALTPPFVSNNSYPATGAALEFAACFLNVKHIILLGHSHCGGIQSVVERGNKALDGASDSLVNKWLSLAQPAYEKTLVDDPQASFEEQVTVCTHYALLSSLGNLMSYPWIEERVRESELTLHAWYISLMTGEIQKYDQQKKCWDLL